MHLKNIVIGLAIVILTTFVVVYGIQTFYERPEYSDFCEEFKTPKLLDTQEACEAEGGQWNDYGARPIRAVEENEATGYCDRDFTCRALYDDARESYSKTLFIITIIVGIILIALGGALFELEAVGAGIMGGGIITLIYGAGSYWQYAGDAFRFILSIIGLILVIFLAYWLNNRQKKGKSWKFTLKARRR